MSSNKKSSRLFQSALVKEALKQSFIKLNPGAMFDNQVNDLVDFFWKVIEGHKKKTIAQKTFEKASFPAVNEKAVADKTYYSNRRHL